MTRGTLTTLSIVLYCALAGAVIICVGLAGSALMSANDRIGDIDTALTSVKAHADPLTYQIAKVNDSLTAIEQSLSPLHSQADTLNGTLSQVQQTLGTANGTVSSVSSLAGNAEGSLAPADQDLAATDVNLGFNGHTASNVNTISSQAAAALGVLTPVENDLSTISGLLIGTNGHLSSACHKSQNAPLTGSRTSCP